jgi:hypothetical protein
VALTLLYFYGGGGTPAAKTVVGGHGAGGRKKKPTWGSGLREGKVEKRLLDFEDDEIVDVIYLISMLDD